MAHHSNHPQHSHHPHPPKKKGLHKDWRLWTAVVLMLAGIAAYVFTLNEALVPGGSQDTVEQEADFE